MTSIRTRRAWGRWLRVRGLPLLHVAAVLGSDVETVEADFRRSLATPDPSGPPLNSKSQYRDNPHCRPILGETSAKVRTLARLGYDIRRVAELLELEPGRVADFISRSQRLRGGDGLLETPRDRAEDHAALRGINRRRRRRARERKAATWGSRGACHRAELDEFRNIPRPPAVAAQASAELPRLEPAGIPLVMPGPWAGPTGFGARGRAKFDRQSVKEVRHLFAEGWTYRALAKRFGTSEQMIYDIVKRRKWAHV